MQRVPELELMSDIEQARAYAAADFEVPHSRVVASLVEEFQHPEITGMILDLGCGPGDVTFRIADRFLQATIFAVDGSAAMIALAEQRRIREGKGQITFIEGFIPQVEIPRVGYDLILSTSFLHHLPDPLILWNTIREHASSGTQIFVYDLLRPSSREEAADLVERYSGNEPEVLKQDFYNSLLAAFTPEEVEQQLVAAGLPALSVKVISDRHLIVFGQVEAAHKST